MSSASSLVSDSNYMCPIMVLIVYSSCLLVYHYEKLRLTSVLFSDYDTAVFENQNNTSFLGDVCSTNSERKGGRSF